MADFWIKVEKSTPDKPEILEMSEILSISDPDTITGKLVRVWSWFDSNSANGHAPLVTKTLLDRLTGVTGFVDSMVKVGWLKETKSGFTIKNHERHLGKTAKKRASDAERKRKSRDNSQESHKESVTEVGLDKSRVDKIKNIIPYQLLVDEYHKCLPELSGVRILTDERKRKIKSVWGLKINDKSGNPLNTTDINFWNGYFTYVNQSDFLMGRNGDWQANFDFLVTKSKFIKIIEGDY